MKRELTPRRNIGGTIKVAGDKSIGHRAALFSILSQGSLTVCNFPDSADCKTSLAAAESLGVRVEKSGEQLVLTPPDKLEPSPDTIIDCGNSGTTARLLSGILAGSDVEVTLSGDESLQSRPMKRIIDPLTEMGAEFFSEEGRLPMKIRGRRLLPFDYRLPVASAQVKSAVLLAGLASGCSVTVCEDTITRDHTELMLDSIGEGVSVRKITPILVPDPTDPRKKRREMPENFKREIKLSGQARVNGGTVDIPGDISTASFMMAAAAIAKKCVTIENLGLNPTRTGIIEHLRQIGCTVEITDRRTVSGESRGTVAVTGSTLNARKISGEMTVSLIDEIPIVAVMAAFAEGTTVIRDASELRVKESDRLTAVAENLKALGCRCGLLDDGLAIEGGAELKGAELRCFGDHRIAMAFAIASMFVVGNSSLDDASVVAISCPEFFDLLDRISQ